MVAPLSAGRFISQVHQGSFKRLSLNFVQDLVSIFAQGMTRPICSLSPIKILQVDLLSEQLIGLHAYLDQPN